MKGVESAEGKEILLFENREIEKINKAEKNVVADHVWSSCRPSPKFSADSPTVTARRIHIVRLELQNNPRLMDVMESEVAHNKVELSSSSSSSSSSHSGGNGAEGKKKKKKKKPFCGSSSSDGGFSEQGKKAFSQKSSTSGQCPGTSQSSDAKKLSDYQSECSTSPTKETESSGASSHEDGDSDFCPDALTDYECMLEEMKLCGAPSNVYVDAHQPTCQDYPHHYDTSYRRDTDRDADQNRYHREKHHQ
ncbi:UNVERIFIED_CONTAM: hypothetical protein PYX00_008595 [Menopon gallinae]|uniref:Uncharacterized protein n=1 Tax=Menopon gallinae TaxID=328185 RepID=A0AAW2HP02_9NEOP